MSKYSYVRDAIDTAVSRGKVQGLEPAEMLLAMIVSTVDDYKNAAGAEATREALTYELNSLGGNLDTAFLRSR